jgi:hypothetical protein
MVEILALKPEVEQRLHSYALKRLKDWRDRIMREVPQLRQLTVEQLAADLGTFLNDNERGELDNCLHDITGWLARCVDAGDSHFPDAYDTQVITPMLRVESLIIKVYRAKDDQKEWSAARKAVNPPLNDAKMYLSDQECDEFIKATREAIQIYTEKGENYLSDMGSLDYRRWLERISNRKEEQRQLALAKLAAREFNRRLNEEKARVQTLLSPNRKNLESYFRKRVKDRRYTGQNFSRLLSTKEKQDLDKILVRISKNKAEERVADDFRSFIATECWRSFFLLPSADYVLEKVPCLGFIFDVFAVVETGVWLRPGQKTFNGYVFDFCWREKKESSSAKTQEFLGYHHLVLTPEALGRSFWQNIPLVLLKGLLSGETRPNGATIVSASDGDVTYKIEGFGEEVEIPTQFAEYLERIGAIDEMVGMGMMTKKVGDIVKAVLSEMESKPEISPAREKNRRRDSMKKSMFRLFDEGRRPGDPEVKALGAKPNSSYRYYQEWKKARGHSQS